MFVNIELESFSCEQISNFVYCDKSILDMNLETKFMPNQYHDYPYLVIDGFFSYSKCLELFKYIEKTDNYEKAMIKSTYKGIVLPCVDKEIRKTKIYKLTKRTLEIYQKSFNKFQNKIEQYFSLALTNASKPQLLLYNEGDFYAKHADDSSEIINAQKQTIGFHQVAPLRKLTSILFLSSCDENLTQQNQFSGGELVFNYLFDATQKNIVIKPKAGMMIVFPSNPIFSHEVLPVKSGKRATLVQWHNAILE